MQWYVYYNIQNYWFTYNDQMNVESVAQSICDMALGFGGGEEKAMVWVL